MRRRALDAGSAAQVAALRGELEHLRERHDEQIERLEDLLREMILAIELLRERLAALESPPREEAVRARQAGKTQP
jgi:phage shock protein A